MEVIKTDYGCVRVSTREQNTQRQLIAGIVLQLLSYAAQTEREFIHRRQTEGIAAAKERGVKFGRRPMERPTEFAYLKALWEQNEISAREAAKQLGITHSTFLRWAKGENG